MKKLILLLAVLPLMALSQNSENRSVRIPPGHFANRADWSCPENSIFSQTFGFQWLYTSDMEYGYKVYDNFSASSGFNIVTFWGVMFNFPTGTNCTNGLNSFRISFYDDDAGAIGSLQSFFDVFVTVDYVATGFGFDTYKFSANLGTMMYLNQGWISIEGNTNDGNECVFMWCDSYDGDLNGYQENGEGWVANDFAFCLSNGNEVPISNWAIIVGIGLIVTLAVIRLRKAA